MKNEEEEEEEQTESTGIWAMATLRQQIISR